MRSLFILGLTLGLPLLGCQNFNECNADEECGPAADGSRLYCTPDRICAKGTPAVGLCAEIYPANAPANAIAVGALVNLADGNDKLPVEAFKLGIDQVNTRRTGDLPLALHICEVGATEDDALKSMQVLARQRKAVGVLGPSSSSTVFKIKDEVIRSGIPIISPSATSPEISSLGTTEGPVNGLFYRVAPSDALQGPVLARQLPASPGKLVVLFVNDPYGSGLKDAFLGAATKQPDLTLSYNEPAGGPDFSGTTAVATQIRNAAPDYLIAITNLHSDTVITALINLPMMTPLTRIIMADGAKNDNVLNLVGAMPQPLMNQHLMRISGTAPSVDTSNKTMTGAYQTFVNDFKVRWPADDPNSSLYTAFGFDAFYAMAIAIGAAGSDVTPARVAEMLGHINQFDPATGLCQVNASNQVIVGQSKYLEAKNKVASTSGLVLQGASGTICFTAHGDRVAGLYEKWEINTSNRTFTSTPTM
jgi:ABC-type branched-subunit amino acid transport system substrate-binding protein